MRDAVLRCATLDDAEALSQYMNALADEQLAQLSNRRPSPEQERDFIQKAAKDNQGIIIIALSGARVVGLLDLWRGEKTYNRHTARLGMSVLADYRRKGIGRKLLQFAKAEGEKWPDLRRIDLEVVSWNEPAIRLYESFGFVREGVLQKAANFHGKIMDLILMALVR